MRYTLIQRERGIVSVTRAGELLKVSPRGYYAWQQRQARPRKVSDEAALGAQIKAIFEESRRTYGSPRVTAALRQHGVVCNRKRVARLMRQHGVVAKHRRRRMRTTDSRHRLPIAPERPNEKWVSDITYIPTLDGWLLLALVLDVFSRKIAAGPWRHI